MVKVRREMRWHILDRLIKQRGFKLGAELGVFGGRNLLYLLENNPNLHMIGVDTWAPNPEADKRRDEGGRSYVDADLPALFDALLVKMQQKGLTERCALQMQDTALAADAWADESFDFVFIDADHTYEGVHQDITNWLPKVKPTGIIAGHDYNPQDFPGVVRAVDELLPGARIESDHVWLMERAHVGKRTELH